MIKKTSLLRVLGLAMVAGAGALAGCDETTGTSTYDPRVDGISPRTTPTPNLAILNAPPAAPARPATATPAAPASRPAGTTPPPPEGATPPPPPAEAG